MLVNLLSYMILSSQRLILFELYINIILQNIKRVHTLWKTGASRTVNIGGLPAVIYTLYRTSQLCLGDSNKDSTVVQTCKDAALEKSDD